MKTFPMFLRMTGRTVVIAGGGEQAAQKCRLILRTEARIRVLSPELEPELADLHREGRIDFHQGPITARDFENTAMVFIATGCRGTDAALHMLAKTAGALVNVVDQPDLCDALTPSIVDRDPVVVAIGTEGTAPVLARQIKTRMEELLEPRLGDLAALAGRLRAQAAARLSARTRRDLWRWVFDGPARRAHSRGAEREAAELIKTAIDTAQIPPAAPAPVALVGAGSGSKDLMTLRAVQRLQEADIIFYDSLIDPDLLDLARRDAERVCVGKNAGSRNWPQDKSSALLVAAARQGKRVVRLKYGDLDLFSRGAEEAAALSAEGIRFEIVPDVAVASAGAAQSGESLTERNRIDCPSHRRNGTRVAVFKGVDEIADFDGTLQDGSLNGIVGR